MRLACVFLVLAPARRVEPFPLLCQAFAQRDPGFPSEAFAGEVDRGAGVAGGAPGPREGLPLPPYPPPPFPRRAHPGHGDPPPPPTGEEPAPESGRRRPRSPPHRPPGRPRPPA